MPSGFASPKTFLGKGDLRPSLVSNWRYLTAWLNGFRSEMTTDINAGYRFGGYVYFTSSGSFVKANYPGLRAVVVECQGGGGAGGGRSTSLSVGSGGGGGGYSRTFVAASSLASSETVTVGAGGTGVTGADGNAGTSSSFGSHGSAAGGGGGFYTATADATVNGGSNGGGVGDLVIAGQVGKAARLDSSMFATYADVESGRGGDSFLGHGGPEAPHGQTGQKDNGAGYGAGGSGIAGSASASAGANGSPGIVIVTLYF